MSSASPLVSILIPTYNRPVFFEEALKSALNQTYPAIEVVVSDDSTTDDTETLVRGYQQRFDNLRYFRNRPGLGAVENFRKCLELARGKYVNYLMDDDLFHPEKIAMMMVPAQQRDDIALVTSARSAIDSNGALLETLPGLGPFVGGKNDIVKGVDVANLCLSHVANYIGEPTTAMFRKDMLDEPFGTFAGRAYGCNSDMASWGVLLSKGNLAYVNTSLSSLRIHDGQQSKALTTHAHGIADWVHQVLLSQQYGFLLDNTTFAVATSNISVVMGRIAKLIAAGNLGSFVQQLDLLRNHTLLWNQLCKRLSGQA
jgi:glycosyltransferase involved in cell wall biosynthesis